MRKYTLIQLLTIIPALLCGRIVETSQFEEILAYVESLPQNTIVLCDLDNTLMMPKDLLGSVAWADHLQHKLHLKGVSKKDAAIVEQIFWKAVQPYIEMRTVDPKTAEVIQQLKLRGVPVLALTARFPYELEHTLKQLHSIGLDFSQQAAIPKKPFWMDLEHAALYEQGIIFASTVNKKSTVLLKFLEFYPSEIQQLIFIDDKQHHVEDVEQCCRQQGIDCLAVRFSGADQYIEQFDPVAAESQWQAFSVHP